VEEIYRTTVLPGFLVRTGTVVLRRSIVVLKVLSRSFNELSLASCNDTLEVISIKAEESTDIHIDIKTGGVS
jgi:hypothetical protein